MSLLIEKIVPGATTCLLVGGLRETAGLNFAGYHALLWWVDAESRIPAPAGIPFERIQIAPIETITPDQTETIIDEFIRRDPKRMPSVLVTRSLNADHAKIYRHIIDEVHDRLESAHRARLTRQLDGFVWQKHILGNVAAYARRRLPASWAGTLRGVPALVCGAGPSLDVSGPKLAAAAERAVIFSADSALRALARHGVAADFAISIDAAKVPEKCLPNHHGPRRVIVSSVSPSSWLSAVSSDLLFFLSGRQVTDDWLATLGIPRTTIAAIESCGSTAIELATFLGCDPIYLFGLDLAVDPVNPARRHQQDADPALYANSNYDPTANLPRVPGNYAETVPCFALGDWRELDARLATRAAPRMFNVNDRGARLRGTTLVHPDEFTFPPAPTLKNDRLRALPFETEMSPQAATTALSRLNAIGDRCTKGIPEMRRILKRNGPARLAPLFRSLLLDPDCGRALGAFSLKIMPHLVPPIEGDVAFWESLLNEFAELSALAQKAGGVFVGTIGQK